MRTRLRGVVVLVMAFALALVAGPAFAQVSQDPESPDFPGCEWAAPEGFDVGDVPGDLTDEDFCEIYGVLVLPDIEEPEPPVDPEEPGPPIEPPGPPEVPEPEVPEPEEPAVEDGAEELPEPAEPAEEEQEEAAVLGAIAFTGSDTALLVGMGIALIGLGAFALRRARPAAEPT